MFNTNLTRYNLLFACTIILLLLLDLGQFFLMGTIIVPFLLCIYCTLLLHSTSVLPLLVIAFLQCLEFFCFYNFFSLAGIFLFPTALLAFFFKKNLYPSIAHTVTLVIASSLIQIYAAEGYVLSTWPTISYTIIRISATLLITICFSLTINIWGMQDNRA